MADLALNRERLGAGKYTSWAKDLHQEELECLLHLLGEYHVRCSMPTRLTHDVTGEEMFPANGGAGSVRRAAAFNALRDFYRKPFRLAVWFERLRNLPQPGGMPETLPPNAKSWTPSRQYHVDAMTELCDSTSTCSQVGRVALAVRHLLNGALVLMLVLFASGCPRVCENAQMRCEANTVQVCTSRGRWQTLFDCKEVRTRDGKNVPGTCAQPPRCAPRGR